MLGFNETEDCLRQLAKIGVPNAEDMISMASRNPVLFDAGASRESVALARDWHTGNWISVEHVDEKRFCARGTRPVDVLGDLVFNVAMSWAITQARSQVPLHDVSASSSALPFPVLDDSVAVSCSDVSFVDDFALLVASASPTNLLDNVRHVRAYSELLAVFGLSLNMSPGKTEAFVTFRGQRAKDAASKLVHQDDHCHVSPHDGRLLRIVRSYVHLGTSTSPSGSHALEVSRRTQSMLHAYLPLAKSTFGEPSFPIKTRLLLAESLLFTRLTFALGSWDPLPLGLKRSMEAARMRVFRMILGEFRKEGGLSDRAVREKLGVCSFDVLVRRHRLLYASRVAGKAPSLLHALFQNVGGAMIPWTNALVDDLAALKRAAPKKLEELPPFEADLQKWIVLWTRFPRQWAQLVKLLPLNDYDDEVDDLPDALVICEICSKRFSSARALAVHRSRAHGKKRLAPQLVDGSTCPACLIDFRTRLRLSHHLEYSSPKCLEIVASEIPPLSLERARELAAIDASQRRRAKKGGVSFLAVGVPCIPAPLCISCTVIACLKSFDSVEACFHCSSLFFWVCFPVFTCHRHSSLCSRSKIKINHHHRHRHHHHHHQGFCLNFAITPRQDRPVDTVVGPDIAFALLVAQPGSSATKRKTGHHFRVFSTTQTS